MKELRKYPVTSLEGKEYEVILYTKGYFQSRHVDIREKRKGLFGIEYFRTLKTYDYFGKLGTDEISIVNTYGSITSFVKSVVSRYEREIRKEIREEEKVKKAIKDFEEWDGVVKHSIADAYVEEEV